MGPMGAPRMAQPNATQLQNQYLPTGQFPGSSPGRGAGPVGMNQPGAQAAVPPVSNRIPTDLVPSGLTAKNEDKHIYR